jgi:hypothetical protein
MKRNNTEWDQDKKLKRVEKGTDKSGKHRKSLYNMLSEYEEEYSDSDEDDMSHNYVGNFSYDKRR